MDRTGGTATAVRDLAEAESWARRRRVAALVTGSAVVTGDDPRPGRTLLLGAVVAAVLVAGVAVGAVLRPPATAEPPEPPDPLGPGLAVVRETGASYAVLAVDGVLLARPVLNPVSARLLLGPAASTPRSVPAAQLAAAAARSPGPPLGVADAPAALPAPDRVLRGGALTCPGPGRPAVPAITAEPPALLGAGTALLVRAGAGGPAWLVVDPGDGVRRLLVPPGAAAEPWLAARGVPPLATAASVPARWLALVPLAPSSAVLPPLAARVGSACLAVTAADGSPRLAAVPPGGPPPPVAPGAAALVSPPPPRAHGAGPSRAGVVDDRGRLLPLRGGARGLLGYGDVEPLTVPASWLALLEPGPTLSPRAAGTASLTRAAGPPPP